MHEYQLEIESLFHKNQLMPRLRAELTASEEFFNPMAEAADVTFDFALDLLVQMILRKRATPDVLVGLLREHYDGDCQLTADALVRAAEADLVDYDEDDGRFIIAFDVSDEIHEEIDRYQYPMPMVCEPSPLRGNLDSAYLSVDRQSVILKGNHTNEDVCLDSLNRLNRIRLRLNLETASAVSNKWNGLDRRGKDETQAKFLERRKAFEKFKRTSADVHAHLAVAGGVFHLTHRYDKRGRVYCQGWHVNYQGNDWNKASVEFADAEIVQ